MSTVAKVWRPALAVGSAVAGAVLGAIVIDDDPATRTVTRDDLGVR